MTVFSKYNLAEATLSEALRDTPGRVAMVFVHEGRRTWTYAEIGRRVAEIQNVLRDRGIRRGDRVAIRLPNSPDYAFAFLAAAAMGAVAVPLSPMLSDAEADFIVDDTGAAVTLARADLPAQRIDPPKTGAATPYFADTGADEAAYIVYTSGSTAQPKGVVHAHRAILGRQPMREGWTDIRHEDVVLHAGHLNWTYTMGIAVFDTFSVGARSVLYGGARDPGVWAEIIEDEAVTVFAAVPGVYRQLLKYGDRVGARCSTLRRALTAGEALAVPLLEAWREETGCELYEALGMSEISTYISSGPSTPIRPGSPGRAQPGRRVAILDPDSDSTRPLEAGQNGLLAIHRDDPGLMLGYWKRPEEEAQVFRGCWFAGGDIAHIDADGYVWFHGRNNELMNAFGYRVSPLEVEAALRKHPAVRDVAVAEAHVRNDVWVVCAWIVADHAPTVDELLAACEELASYKRPREFRLVESLPRTRTGKMKRSALDDTAYTELS